MDTTFNINGNINAAYSDVAASTVAVSKTTTKIRVWASTDCFMLIGSDPTATASNSTPLTGKIMEYFNITPGHKVSFLRQTVNGIGYVTEVNGI